MTHQPRESHPGGHPGKQLAVLVSAPFPSVRRGLLAMLDEHPDLNPVGEQDEVAAGNPDVVVVYTANGVISGTSLEQWQVPIVYVVEGFLAELPDLSERPVALLPAEADSLALHAAVRAVAQGLSVIDTTFAGSAGIVWRQPLLPSSEQGEHLSPREIEVLNLVAQGWPNKTIANALGISEHTVKFHVGSILGKLGAESRTEAVTIATRRGLVVF